MDRPCARCNGSGSEPGRPALADLAATIKASLLASPATPAYLKDASYSAAVDAYAFAQAKVGLLREHADGYDLESERLLAYYVRRLGLDPLSRAELGRSFAAAVKADLAEIWKDKPEGGKPE